MSKNKDVKRGIVLYIDGKEVKRDVTDIKAEIRKLTKELSHMTIGSKEYNDQMAKIKHLNSIVRDHKMRLREVNEELGKNRISVGKLVDGFNRFGGVIVSVIGFLTGFVLALRSIREERNELEESQAGLKALTGLDDESITWLTAQAKTLSTTMTKEGLRVRQSAAEILDAFMLVGSAKPELLGNKEALRQVAEEAMRLQAAAKDITLNEAVDSLTLSLNQYGAAADQAGKFSNVLAAGSKAGSANIASQAKAIRTSGTAAAAANISIEQTVGLIETLAYKGIKDEVAGTGLKRFFLKLQTGADETNPKIVGLDKALENLKNKNMDAGAIKKMFGEEGFNAASVILHNTEMVNDFTKAVTGTNIAYEQSAINSATADSKLDQARNSMKLAAIELGEKLNPAFTVSTNMMANVVKFLPGLIDWFQKWGGTVVYVASVIAIYSMRVKIATIATTKWNAITKIATALQLAYGIAINTVAGYTITSFTQMRKLSILMQGHTVLLKTLRITTYLYAAAVHTLHLRMDMAAKSIKAAWAIMSVNPVTLLAALVLAAATASYKLTQRTKDYYDLNKVNAKTTEKSNEEYTRQSFLIEQLTAKIHNNNLSNFERVKAINELKSIIPGYNAEIDKEGKIIDENTTALDRYNSVLATNLELKQVADDLGKHRGNLNNLRNSPALNDNSLMGAMAREDVRNKISKEEAIVASLTDRYKKLVQEKWRALNPTTKNENGDNGDGNIADIQKEKDKFAKVEEAYYQRISAIKKKYLADDQMTQEDYNQQMQQAEMQLLQDKLKVKGLEPSEIQQINDLILNAEIKARDELRKLDEQSVKDTEKMQKEQSEKAFSRLDKEYQMQIEEATMYHYQNKTSEEEYLNELRQLQKNYYDKVLNDTAVSEEDKQKIRKQNSDAEIEDAKKKYEAEVEAFTSMKDNMMDVSKQLGESMAEFFTNEEQDFGDFMKNVLVILLDTLEKQLIATQAAAIAEVTIKDISTKGLLGLAAAAGKIALITAAFETAKGLLGNFYTGGYTGSGDWDQPQGIVHSNEFVANRYAVANPAVRPVLDLIDNAQRTGSIGNLTAEDIASVVGSGSTTQASQAAQVVQIASAQSDHEMTRTINELNSVIEKLIGRLNDPFYTLNVISGRSGLKNKLDEYETLLNNKSRKS